METCLLRSGAGKAQVAALVENFVSVARTNFSYMRMVRPIFGTGDQ
jgi:hypothetical protein